MNHDFIFQSAAGPWATTTIIDSDSAVFGFPVAWFTLDASLPGGATAMLDEWTRHAGAVVTGTSVTVAEMRKLQVLQSLGFVCIDLSLHMSLLSTRKRPRTLKGGEARLAVQEDHEAIVAIAGSAFDFGRYHRDVRFPRALADARFAQWMHGALLAPKPGMRCYVLGSAGDPAAFMLVEVIDGRAQLHLGGVARTASNGLFGPMLFAGVLDKLEASGVRTVWAKVSAANTAVLNIYAEIGFQTGKPEFTLHKHLTESPHLISLTA